MSLLGIDFPSEIVLFLTFAVSFLIAYLSIPSVVGVAHHKNFFDEPSRRKSHLQQTPTLGGVAIFAGFAFSAGVFIDFSHLPSFQYILVACIIIFFLFSKQKLKF
jgi:UDP-N-acetylmuramyl pentapeptide phosphotransferase/UDP-N-acetylglucosamine-1-phosphate transferase